MFSSWYSSAEWENSRTSWWKDLMFRPHFCTGLLVQRLKFCDFWHQFYHRQAMKDKWVNFGYSGTGSSRVSRGFFFRTLCNVWWLRLDWCDCSPTPITKAFTNTTTYVYEHRQQVWSNFTSKRNISWNYLHSIYLFYSFIFNKKKLTQNVTKQSPAMVPSA